MNRATTGIKALKETLANFDQEGSTSEFEVGQTLSEYWHLFDGSRDEGMKPWKLVRMEQVRWNPPILRFVIERHGGLVLGSTRAELQHWEVDLDSQTARIAKKGHRQQKPMTSRVPVLKLADEIAGVILSGQDDDRIQRRPDGSVRVLTSKIFPAEGEFQRTVTGRRKRFRARLEALLGPRGWKQLQPNVFTPGGME